MENLAWLQKKQNIVIYIFILSFLSLIYKYPSICPERKITKYYKYVYCTVGIWLILTFLFASSHIFQVFFGTTNLTVRRKGVLNIYKIYLHDFHWTNKPNGQFSYSAWVFRVSLGESTQITPTQIINRFIIWVSMAQWTWW